MHDVFISYSNKNKDVADSICHYLEDTGIRCWYAPRDLTPGSDWKEGIVNAITEAQIFILIYSEESNHSEQVKSELAVAEDCECKIFTFRISDEKMNPSFTYSLKKLHWIDAINTPLQNSIKELRARVWMNLGRDEGAALIEELPKAQTS